MKYGVEEQLHPDAADLVDRFSVALRAKLYQAQCRYKWTNDWKTADPNALRTALMDHLMKGDPRDVAAYCAFLWDLGETTVHPQLVMTEEKQRNMDAYFKASRELDDEL